MEVLHLGYFPGWFEKILWLFSLRFLLLWKVSKVGKGIILLQPFPIWIDLRQILFSHSLGNSWQRVPNPRILWRNPYIAYSTFFQILTKLPPQTPHTHPNPPHSFCCPVSLIAWIIAPHLVLFYLMTWWIYTCWALVPYLAGIYLLKVNNRKTRTRCEIYSELIIKIPERRHW